MPVVVSDVLAHGVEKVSFAVDEDVVQALPPCGADPAFRERVRPRRSRGIAHDPHALRREDRVRGPDELRVPVADREPELVGPLAQNHEQVAGLLGHPLTGRMGRGAEQVDPTGCDLHDEPDLDTFETDRVHVKEVAGQDGPGLVGEELGPDRAVASGCGVDSVGVEDLPHRAGGDLVAQPDQLAMDATVARV